MVDDAFDMTAARRLWAEKEATQSHGKAKAKRQELAGAIDKRSLRKTGRTEQYNLRVRAGFKKQVADGAERMASARRSSSSKPLSKHSSRRVRNERPDDAAVSRRRPRARGVPHLLRDVGTYEYLMKDQGSFNYIVKAGCGVTIGTALLPVFAGMAWRARKYARALLLWLIFPFAVGVVFFAAIDRTGGTADLAQQQRAKDARARTLAEKTEKEATAAHATATEAAGAECSVGPPGKNRGNKCLEAEGKRDAAQGRLDGARAVLLKAPVKETDPWPNASPHTGDRITEEQVRLYRPLFLPLVLSILAGVFLSLGAHMGPTGSLTGFAAATDIVCVAKGGLAAEAGARRAREGPGAHGRARRAGAAREQSARHSRTAARSHRRPSEGRQRPPTS